MLLLIPGWLDGVGCLFFYLAFVGVQAGRLMRFLHQQDVLIRAADWWPPVSTVTIIVLRAERPGASLGEYKGINHF